MKKSVCLLALCLVLAMIFAVAMTGCGAKKNDTGEPVSETKEAQKEDVPGVPTVKEPVTAESLMSKFASYETHGLSFDALITMDMQMVMFGEHADMKMTGVMKVDSEDTVAHLAADMHSETVGMSENGAFEKPDVTDTHMDTYAVRNEDGTYTIYTLSAETGEWYKEEEGETVMKFSDAVAQVSAEDLVLTEEEDEYVLTGELDLAKAQEIFGESFDLSSLAEVENVDLTKVEKAVIIYRFDKETENLKSVDLDMTKLMQSIMDESLKISVGLLAGEGLEDENAEDADAEEKVDMEQLAELFAVTINSVSMHMDNFDFSVHAGKIELPEAALNAKLRVDTTGK